DRGHRHLLSRWRESWIAYRGLASRPPRMPCAYGRPDGRRSGAPRPLFVPGVAGGLLLALAQLGLVDVADVANPRSARPVLAPVHAAAHVELVPGPAPPQSGCGTKLPSRPRGDLPGELI